MPIFCLSGNTAFNEKPYFEQKKCFSAKYIGWTEVTKSSGIFVVVCDATTLVLTLTSRYSGGFLAIVNSSTAD